MSQRTVTFTAIGTAWTIMLFQEVPGLDAVVLPAVIGRIAAFDATYSRFREDSWLSRIGQETGRFALPPDAEPLFSMYRALHERTGGEVTPLVGELLVAAGYDASYSLQDTRLPGQGAPRWSDCISFDLDADPGHITILRPCRLDVGACGKGYLVDIIIELLAGYGVTECCVNAGGDIAHRSTAGERIRVGLEDPFSSEGNTAGKVFGVYHLSGGSIAGSAGNRRKWGTGHHIMSAITGVSPTHIAGVWVVARTTLLADAMTTALFFAEPQDLLAEYAFDYLIVRPDGSLEGSLLPSSALEIFQ